MEEYYSVFRYFRNIILNVSNNPLKNACFITIIG